MNKARKIIAGLLAVVLAMSMMTSCKLKKGSDEPQESAEEIALKDSLKENDYKGGVNRTLSLKTNVLAVMENMKQNNETIRTENPNTFWNQEGYQDFVVNFLNSDIINDTKYFGEEEEGGWEGVVESLKTTENSFTHLDDKGNYVLNSDTKVLRNEKDDYSVSAPGTLRYNNTDYNGMYNYHILYDCDKDWCKSYAETNFNAPIPSVTAKLYEYARIDKNTFAIQTSKERLVIVLEDSAEDVSIKDRQIKEFYYSKLTDGVRTSFMPYEAVSIEGLDDVYSIEAENKNKIYESYPFVNEKGDLSNLYGKNDSIFLTNDIVGNINGKWAFAEKTLQQAIVYKDGALVVITFNKLSEGYEKFIYTLEGVSDSVVSEIEGMIEIKDLVGLNNQEPVATVPDSTVQETGAPDSSSASGEEESSMPLADTAPGETAEANEPDVTKLGNSSEEDSSSESEGEPTESPAESTTESETTEQPADSTVESAAETADSSSYTEEELKAMLEQIQNSSQSE